jgi:hypothetical protein
VLGEEGEGRHNHHQKRNGYNELRKNCVKLPTPFEAVEVHLKVEKGPRHDGSEQHE